MSLSGKNDKCILKSDDIVDLAIYKSKIYYIKYSDNGCYLYNISTSGGKSKRMFGNSKAYIESIKIYSDYIYFNYHGTGFLQNMVRILTGTLLEVGQGKRTPESVRQTLEAKDRTQAGYTAPPQGLCLMRVDY